MSYKSTLLIFAAVGALVVSAVGHAENAGAGAPKLLRDALAHKAADPAQWHFLRVTRVKSEERRVITVTDRHDPTKPEGGKYQLVEVCDANGKPLTSDEYDGADNNIDHDMPDYADLGTLIDKDIELVSEDRDKAVYAFRAKGEEMRDFGDIEMEDIKDSHIVGRATVVKSGKFAPYVSAVNMQLDAPKGNLIARVNDLKLDMAFGPEGEDGEMLAREFGFVFGLQALAFINVDIDIQATYSDFKKPAIDN